MKKFGQAVNFTMPKTHHGCWDLDYQQDDIGDDVSDVALTETNRLGKNRLIREVCSFAHGSMVDAGTQAGNLRLMLSSPKMYMALLAVHKNINSEQTILLKQVEDALDCAENFVIPWDE